MSDCHRLDKRPLAAKLWRSLQALSCLVLPLFFFFWYVDQYGCCESRYLVDMCPFTLFHSGPWKGPD